MDRRWIKFYDEGVPASLKPYPEIPLFRILEDAAAKYPDRPAIHFKPERVFIAKSSITYRELNELSDRLAAALAAQGVKKGDRVAIFMPNTPQFIITFYAILKVGGVVVASNPTYTRPELEHQLSDSGAVAIVCMSRFYETVKQVVPHTRIKTVIVTNIKDYMNVLIRLVFTLTREAKGGDRVQLAPTHMWFKDIIRRYRPEQRPNVSVTAEDAALFQYSGGTTGIPKAAIALHRNLVANTLQNRAWTGVSEGSRETTIAAIPLFHVYGMVTVMLLGVSIGAEIVVVPNPRDIASVIDAIDTYRPTLFSGVPRMYNAINNFKGIEKYNLRTIRNCVSGSAPLLLTVKRQFEAITGGRLIEGYGMSEAPTSTHSNPLRGINKEGSIGVPFPDVEARIISLKDEVTELPQGESGELVVRGPQVMYGYHNMPEETRNALRKDPKDPDGAPWLYTGDIARMDEDGYFYLVDRKKELIKVGGFQVWPREVEEALVQHPAVLKVAAAGVPDPEQGFEVVKAWVVLKPDMKATERELIAFCEDKLVQYKRPRYVEFRSELPETQVGKILRRELIAQEKAKQSATSK
jgi:long-chain acyl-CoA synthetase